jgi:hypothetical protein
MLSTKTGWLLREPHDSQQAIRLPQVLPQPTNDEELFMKYF